VARRRFWDLIDEMSDRGTTVFVSTHYMEEAEYCHRLALLNRGRLIALDSPRALRGRVVEPILNVKTDHAPTAIAALNGAAGVLDAAMFGRALHVTVEDVDGGTARVRSALERAGRRVDAIEPIQPSLEDVFVSLVRAEGGAVVG
jgi:ABC-2 type transport system ATP-binding protein